jgi:Domain of unknown function (DUF222)/HNH endonuclease
MDRGRDWVTGGGSGVHPVTAATVTITRALDELTEVPLYGLVPEAVGELLTSVVGLEARLAGLRMQLISAAETVGTAARAGAPGTAAWLRGSCRIERVAAGRAVRLAKALAAEHECTGRALSEGRVSEAQARVIVRAIQALPSSVDAATRRTAEAHLVEQAAIFDPLDLARLGRHVLDVVAPDEADRLLGEALHREEARANRRHLTLRPDGHGGTRVSGRLDPEAAALLDAALEPLAKPRPADQEGPDPRTRGERQADALAEICRRFLAATCCTGGGLPDTCGEPTTVVVTIRETDLRSGLGAALLPTGDAVSASTARRMACDARIMPAVLGGDSMPLDLGRARRLFTPAQRRALALRDGDGCAFPGCDRPGTWTEAHHRVHWADGGPTDVSNGVLLCSYHHQVVHAEEWRIVLGADGRPDFLPPAWLDQARRPRRNTRWRRLDTG